jgi:2-dehydropantoate 2-reductase
MKIGIVGMGAIGGWLAAGLAAAGHEVSGLARGETLQALRTQGLRFSSGEQTQCWPIHASDKATDLGPQDLVVIALKSQALPSLAPSLAPLIAPHTVVMSAMNGVPWWFFQGFGGALSGTHLQAVDPRGLISQAIPAHQVLGCVVHGSSTTLAPGHVRLKFAQGLILGEPSGGASARLNQWVEVFQQAGFATKASERIQFDTWYKLWGNLTMNPVSALTGASSDLILGDPLVRQFMSQVMLEAKTIGAQLGLPFDQSPEDRHLVTAKLGAFKTSMLQDVEAGRAIELDALVTAVQEIGRLTQIATPFTDALLGLTRLRFGQMGLYEAAPSTTENETRGATAHISS